MKKLAFSATVGAAVALTTLVVPALAEGDADLIKNAETAAPAAVSSGATIYAPQADGSMKTLREGNNGFWCMPNDPATPGDDPWCGDANSLEWAMAWMSKKDPPKGKVGLIYMLNGGSDASNTDPFATAPTEGNNWIKTGRHIMIMNATDLMAGYPTDPKPDTSRPYVMWHGTPYAHLMVPVE
jgi:predicted RecA/RadA family phage recombinase